MRISPLPATPTAPPTTTGGWPIDPVWERAGQLQDARLNELSGLAASQAREGVLWAHNDSGDVARVFAVDQQGRMLQEVRITGATAFDWEDISVGPGRGGRGSAVYVADTGDNFLIRRASTIYRIPEPVAGQVEAQAERIEFTFPDGSSRDVEAMTVDPRSGDVYVVSKQRRAGDAEVFRLPRADVDAGGGVLELTGRLPDVGRAVTGADVSADGSRIAITTYERVYEWRREPGETVAAALQRAPVRSTGGTDAESIAYTPDGRSLVTIPEGANATIYRAPAFSASV